MDERLMGELDSMSPEELKQLKHFLFEERINIQMLQDKQQQDYEKFLKERQVFMDEMKSLNKKIVFERKRLKDESAFFDKKMAILQRGFYELELDRKQFEKEKKKNQSKEHREFTTGSFDVPYMFKGVNNILGLKKRYKDLMKIFHPDNICGDSEAVKDINQQYDDLKKKFDVK